MHLLNKRPSLAVIIKKKLDISLESGVSCFWTQILRYYDNGNEEYHYEHYCVVKEQIKRGNQYLETV